ncbi:hypothetical protein QFZ96_001974 [Paraburkholderia youngii]
MQQFAIQHRPQSSARRAKHRLSGHRRSVFARSSCDRFEFLFREIERAADRRLGVLAGAISDGPEFVRGSGQIESHVVMRSGRNASIARWQFDTSAPNRARRTQLHTRLRFELRGTREAEIDNLHPDADPPPPAPSIVRTPSAAPSVDSVVCRRLIVFLREAESLT